MINKYDTIGWKVDLQEDFMNEERGKLAIQNAMSIVKNIEETENILRQYKIPILGSMDWHHNNSSEFPKKEESPDFKQTFPEHCIANTYGAQFIKEAQPKNPMYIDWNREYNLDELTNQIMKHEGDVIFRKDAFDVFSEKGNKHTGKILEKLNVKSAIVYGVALEVCNDYAIKGLSERGIQVYAVTDAMKAINEDNRQRILDDWESKGAKLIKSEQLLAYSTIQNIYR